MKTLAAERAMMTRAPIQIVDERAEHAPAIERLLDVAFGEARWRKTCQRLRDGQVPLAGLSLVALAGKDHGPGKDHEGDAFVGTVRLWPVLAGRRRALLLGPLAVDPAWRSQGIGAALMTGAVARAEAAGEPAILLVGDAPYYERFGFRPALTRGLTLPGPVDRARFLARELVPGWLSGARGLVTAPATDRKRAA